MGKLVEIWRHPIKSHGRETLESIEVKEGHTLPGDRDYAVAHDQSDADGSTWVPCQNFSRGSKAPGLMAINLTWNEAQNTMTLTHPKLPDLTINPDDPEDQKRFLAWEAPLIPDNRAQSARLVRAASRGMTDTDYIMIGDVTFEVRERVVRCLATTANPKTGLRDADTLGTLDTWGHRDFTVAAYPKTSGVLRIGAPVRLA
ncbi:MAG: MOSC N-terminal beta barrel domain-containing protein [Paracoccaceae bacterium]